MRPITFIPWSGAGHNPYFGLKNAAGGRQNAVAGNFGFAGFFAWDKEPSKKPKVAPESPEPRMFAQTSGRDYRNLSIRRDMYDLVEWAAKQPDLPCRTFQAVPIGEPLRYRIPLVANARRFRAGHCVRLFLTSDDHDPNMPAFLTFRHASVGTSSLNTVRSSSRLVLPVVSG